MSSTIRFRAFAAFFAVTTGALLLAGGPTQAAPSAPADSGRDDVCWANADTGKVQCFPNEAAFRDAVAEQTGTVLDDPESGSASGASAALLTTYTLARFYEDANYLGATLSVTSLNSATCATGSVAANFSATWNDRVSSFRSYLSCTTRIFEDPGQAGTWFGYSVNAPGVGALNDEASSYRVQ